MGPLINPQDREIIPPEFNLEVAAISKNLPLGSSFIGGGAATLIVSNRFLSPCVRCWQKTVKSCGMTIKPPSPFF